MNAPDTMLADSVRRLLAQHEAPGAHAAAPPSDAADVLGPAFVAAGFTQALIAEAGDDPRPALADGVAILREAAYHAVALPLAESMLANWLAAHAGWEPEPALCTVALDGAGAALALCADAIPVALPRVPWGGEVDVVYALAALGAKCRVVRLEGATVAATGANLADEPRNTLRIDPDVRAAVRIGADADPQQVLALGAVLRSAQMVGAMERTLDLALDHARTRVQFGRTIGTFQAVQQLLAQHANHVAAAAAALDLAVDYWGSEHAIFHAGIAKSRTGEAAGFAAECAHQIVAAMGYAMEHPLQRVTRRLWTWRDDCGNEAYWNTVIGTRVLAHGAGGAWPALVDHPPAPLAGSA
jgi:acyl-CoA dehydrogenase